MCLEREIGVEDHCQHSRRSHTHTQPKLPCSENVSGGEEHSIIPSFFSFVFVFFAPYERTFFARLTLNWNNGVYRDLVKICD